MPASRMMVQGIDFGVVRAEFDLPGAFSAAAQADAENAVDRFGAGRVDETGIAFVTIDPPGSMDLDQAVHIEKTSTGYVVHYAIADVAAVVTPGGALDIETRKRGQTFYLPDGSVPLHPRALSEGSASLLPDVVRPAALWRIELDAQAEPTSWQVKRALVKSVARLDYSTVQRDADAGTLHPSIALLPEFGRLRSVSAVARGAIELKLPEQSVVRDQSEDESSARWRIELEPRTEADDWNAEVSLLTGMCAGRMMIDAGIGLLRTLPPAEESAVRTLRRTAVALGITWPEGQSVGQILAGLDSNEPSTMALMSVAPSLLRGADYAAFDGRLPELTVHAGDRSALRSRDCSAAPAVRSFQHRGVSGDHSWYAGTGMGAHCTSRAARHHEWVRLAGEQGRPCVHRSDRVHAARRPGRRGLRRSGDARQGRKALGGSVCPVGRGDCEMRRNARRR